MTKVATIETHRLLALLIIVAMLAAMIPIAVAVLPSGVLAADNASVSGSFIVSNGAPIVNTVALHSHGGGTTGTMSPTTEYELWVNVTDNNTLEDLSTITLTLYYDANGTYNTGDRPGSANNNTCAIITYTNLATDTWVLSNSSTTWTVEADCSAPTMTGNTGDFKFHFKAGKVAQETNGFASEWHAYAIANDGTGTGDNYQEDLEMNWYGEITGVTANVSFGTVALGVTQSVSTGAVSATYISNGDFDEQVKTTSTWNGTSENLALDEDGSPGDSAFSIEADDDNGAAGAVYVKATAYTNIDDTGTMTDETGHIQANNYLWLTLGASGIPTETYSGTVYYAIANP